MVKCAVKLGRATNSKYTNSKHKIQLMVENDNWTLYRWNSFSNICNKQITGKEFNVIDLGNELYEAVMQRYEALQNNGFEKMLSEYNQSLFGSGEKVKLKKDNAVFETTIKRVSSQGTLVTTDTIEREFSFDEVEWIMAERWKSWRR